MRETERKKKTCLSGILYQQRHWYQFTINWLRMWNGRKLDYLSIKSSSRKLLHFFFAKGRWKAASAGAYFYFHFKTSFTFQLIRSFTLVTRFRKKKNNNNNVTFICLEGSCRSILIDINHDWDRSPCSIKLIRSTCIKKKNRDAGTFQKNSYIRSWINK